METFLKKNFTIIEEKISDSVKKTKYYGKIFAKEIKKGNVIGLIGNLGAGKTYFIKGFISFYGFDEKDVVSPTFLFVKEFKNDNHTIFHFDLYRKDNLNELTKIGFRENYLSDENAIILIEWADKIKEIYKFFDYIIKIEHISNKKRKIIIYKRK